MEEHWSYHQYSILSLTPGREDSIEHEALLVLAWQIFFATLHRSRIYEHTISLRFLSIILRVLKLEVSVNNVFITEQFQTPFAQRGGGGGGRKSVSRVDCE
jgi:hypothetical protein